MNKDYEYIQKEIDKLLKETSLEKTHTTYQKMKTDEKYKSAIKKIGKLTLELEKLEDENRREIGHKINTNN